MKVTNKIKIHLDDMRIIPDLHAVQGDTARVVEVSLYEGSTAWTIPTGAAVLVRFRKPDGTGGTYDTIDGSKAYSISGSTVTVALAPQALTVPGSVSLQVAIVAGEDVLSTFTIKLQVQEDPSVGVEESTDYTDIGEWILPQAIEAAEQAMDAASAASKAAATAATAAAKAATAAAEAELLAKSVTSHMVLTYELGSINTTSGADADSTIRIRSGYFPMLSDTVNVLMPNTLMARLVFYDADLVCLDKSTSPAYESFVRTNADAAFARILVGYADDSAVTDVSKLASMVTVRFPFNDIDSDGASAIYVTVTQDSDGSTCADKTYSELMEAYYSGRILCCRLESNGVVLPLAGVNDVACLFSVIIGRKSYWVTISDESVKLYDTDLTSGDFTDAEVLQLTPEFANSIEECTDTSKLYVLPDGYIYAYTQRHIVNTSNEYDPNTARLNYRLNSSGAETAYDGALLLGDFIEVELVSPYTVNISGVTLVSTYGAYGIIHYYDENYNRLGQYALDSLLKFSKFSDGDYSIDLYNETYAGAKYVRIWLGIGGNDTAITEEDVADLVVEFEPKNVDTYTEAWGSTGLAFVPADYEDRIIDLEEQVAALSDGDTAAYPAVWEDAVAACIEKIKALQKAGGRNCVTFPFFSDNHQRLGYAGALIAKVMEECKISYCFYGGDAISSGYIATAEAMEAQDTAFDQMMKPIPDGRLCRAVGNHDGYYAVSAEEKYRYNWERIYELFMREQSTAQNKHFGGDGTYFYVDELASKVRFIVLNSQWAAYAINEDGTMNNADGAGYGQEQTDWLVNTALKFEESGWGVVFISHAPITNNYHSDQRDARIVQGILTAYANKAAYSGEYTGAVNTENNVSVSVDFTDAITADLIGWFSGHIHRDRIYQCDHTENAYGDDTETVTLPWKTVTITSDANSAYDDTEAERDMNGDTSHAIDFVTIDRDACTVSLTRLGIGFDRSYGYTAAVNEDVSEEVPSINPIEATEDMTQPVGVDELGGLWTAPGSGGIKETVLVDLTTTEEASEFLIPLADVVEAYNKCDDVMLHLYLAKPASDEGTELGTVSAGIYRNALGSQWYLNNFFPDSKISPTNSISWIGYSAVVALGKRISQQDFGLAVIPTTYMCDIQNQRSVSGLIDSGAPASIDTTDYLRVTSTLPIGKGSRIKLIVRGEIV